MDGHMGPGGIFELGEINAMKRVLVQLINNNLINQ